LLATVARALSEDAAAPRSPVGSAARDRRLRQPFDFDRSEAARRPDGFDARGGSRSAAEGIRKAPRVARGRARPRRDQPAELAAHQSGAAAAGGAEPPRVLYAAG